MVRLEGLLQNVPKLHVMLPVKPTDRRSDPSLPDGYSNDGTSQLPTPFEGVQIHGRLNRNLSLSLGLGCGAPGELIPTAEHRWVLTPEQAPKALVEMARKAYVVVKEPELADALEALEALAGSKQDAFTWRGPLLKRNLAMGDRSEVFVKIDAQRRPDGRLDVKASFPEKVQSKVLVQAKAGHVAQGRKFQVSFPGRRNVDAIADGLRGWSRKIGMAEDDGDARRLEDIRSRSFERDRKSSHHAAVMALFDSLWPPSTKPNVRQKARDRVQSRLEQQGNLSGQEFLAAMLVPGARGQVRKATEKLSESPLWIEGTCRLETQPVEELTTKVDLQGSFQIQVQMSEPIRSDFLVDGAMVRIESTGSDPVHQRELDGAAELLEAGLEDAHTGPSSGPDFRIPPAPAAGGDGAFLAHQTALLQAEKIKHGILKADGKPGPRANFECTGLLYYGSGHLELDDVFRSGIPPKPRAQVFDLLRHQNDDPRSGLRGSCQSPETPAGFADEGGYVYALFPVGGGLDLQVLDHEKDGKQASGARGETEFAFGSNQPSHVIVGAYPVGQRIHEDRPEHRLGAFIPNPNVSPALLERLPEQLQKHFPKVSS